MITREPIADASHTQAPASSAVPKVSWVRRPWFLALVLVVVTFFAYQPAWRAGFVWEDDDHLTANSVLAARDGLRVIWTSPFVARYFPLTLTTFWIERHLWGLHPMPYHLVNVLFHAANAVLVFFLLRRLRIPAPWLVATAWAIHPVNVESVAWITELKNAQSGLFFFASLLLFLMFAEEIQRSHCWYAGYLAGIWYVLALVCAAAAMLSNASTAVLAPVLLLPVWWQRGYAEKADAVRIAPFLAMSWLAAGFAIFQRYAQLQNSGIVDSPLPLAHRFIIAGKIIWFYAAKVLCPFRLSFVYPRWDIHPSHVLSWIPLAALLAAAVALWRARHRPWCRAVLLGGAYFVFALSPALGLVKIPYFQYSFVADHFQYLASAAIITLVCAGIAVLFQQSGPLRRLARHGSGDGGIINQYTATVAIPLVLLTLGTLTWRHARVFQNQEILWRDTIAKNPHSAMAHCSLGNVLLKSGRLSAAAAQYELALRISPDYVEAHGNLGSVFLEERRFRDAIAHYEQAVRLNPQQTQLQCNLAIALEQAGRTEEAIAHYQQVLEIDPDLVQARNNLGNILYEQGRFNDAIDQYQRALQVDPDFPELQCNLANALQEAGRTEEAIAHYQQALYLKPNYARARCNLAQALVRQGKFTEAIGQYQQALRIKPDSPETHFALANAFQRAGRIDEAFVHYEQAQWIESNLARAPSPLRLQLED
jgi:tetratricopeptide (TPR) repeat protein